ncbi:MAG: YMGG-like glycine zipper-containing protein [Acidobacteriota bacterium]
MRNSATKRNIFAMVLALVFMFAAVSPEAFGQRRYRQRPSKTKHIAIGTAIGAVGGALIAGKKGALIGAGAGAGTGYVIYKKKKRHNQRSY